MKAHANRFINLINQIKPLINEVNIAIVEQKLSKQHHFYLIDVREKDEWNHGHLPNALHISKGVLERDIEKYIVDVNSEIILYCGSGYRSAIAAESLQRMGFTNVYSLNGGFGAWLQAGKKVIVDDM